MEFINSEEFLKLSKNIQKLLTEWWLENVSSYSLVAYKNSPNYVTFYGDIESGENVEIIPLFTEGELRQIIEKITEDKILFDEYEEWYVYKNCAAYKYVGNENLGDDLLHAYWKVICKIAKNVVGD